MYRTHVKHCNSSKTEEKFIQLETRIYISSFLSDIFNSPLINTSPYVIWFYTINNFKRAREKFSRWNLASLSKQFNNIQKYVTYGLYKHSYTHIWYIICNIIYLNFYWNNKVKLCKKLFEILALFEGVLKHLTDHYSIMHFYKNYSQYTANQCRPTEVRNKESYILFV